MFYNDQMQQGGSEWLMMLIEVISKGSIPYCGSNDDNATGVSLSDILLSFMLEKYIGLQCMWTEISLIWV